MPTTYECPSCPLALEVGWCIHPSFDDGYAATTLLVCSVCGFQHAVKIALRSPRPEIIQYFVANLVAVPEASRASVLAHLCDQEDLSAEAATAVLNGLPWALETDMLEHQGRALRSTYAGLGAAVELAVVREHRNPHHGPLQHDKLLARDAAPRGTAKNAWRELAVRGAFSDEAGGFEVALQACGGCQRVGALVSSWPADRVCPACGGRLG